MKTHEDLKALLDGELSPEEAANLQNALREDPELDREARLYRALSDEIRALAIPVNPEAGERAVQAIRRPGGWERIKPIRWQIAGLAALSLVMLVAMVSPLASSRRSVAVGGRADSSAERAKLAASPNGGGDFAAPMNEAVTSKQPSESRAEPLRMSGKILAPGYREDSRRVMDALGTKSASGLTTSEAHEYMRPKLIRSSDMVVTVTDAFRAQEELERTVRNWDGFVLNGNISTTQGVTSATLDVRVPEGRFEEALVLIRGLGNVLSEQSVGEDVTARVIDSRTRVEVLADEESNLIKRLGATRNEMVKAGIRYELTRVRLELASWKAQAKALDEQTKYSTIRATFRADGSVVGSNWAGSSFGEATKALGGIGQVLGQWLIYVLVFTPVWLPLAWISWLIYRRR